MDDKKIIKNTLNIALPIALGGGILYWMYRDFNFSALNAILSHDMNWWWMAFSLVFGVTAQLFRGLRWKQLLEPIGEHPRKIDCIHAVFISYAASIVIPRIGEIARCGVLKKYDDTSFSKSIGTVVTERIIDSLLVIAVTTIVFAMQLSVFMSFLDETGTNIQDILTGFSVTGYIVVGVCIVATFVFLRILMKRFAVMMRLRKTCNNIKEGILSLKKVKNKYLFCFYTVMIWVSYFLHYSITFYCFDFTSDLGFTVALVSFIVGSISVIVPTPNGAGPWHFAVKTILVLYGLSETDAEAFVLVVHTIQTALIPLLGIYSLVALQLGRRRN